MYIEYVHYRIHCIAIDTIYLVNFDKMTLSTAAGSAEDRDAETAGNVRISAIVPWWVRKLLPGRCSS